MEPTPTAQWIRDQRRARDMTLTALAEAVGVSHVSVMNWESGRNSPSKDSMRKLVAYFNGPAPLPDVVPARVVMAAMELAEWALAPVALPNEAVASEEDLAAVRQILSELPAGVAKALRTLGGFTPKRRRGGGRRPSKNLDFGIDFYRALKCGSEKNVYDVLIDEMGCEDVIEARSFPVYPRAEGGPSLRELAVRLDVPLPRILNDAWFDRLVGDPDGSSDQVRSLISHFHLFYWMRDLNFTPPETLALDMAVDLEEVTAILEYRAEPTPLWFERWKRATGVNPAVIGWTFPPPKVPEHMELRVSTFREHIMRSELNGENARLPEFRRVTPEGFAEILQISQDEMRCIIEGETMATTLFCERVLRGLSISHEDGMMVTAVPADRRIPIRA